MQEDSGRRQSRSSEDSATGRSCPSFDAKEKLKAFLKLLSEKHTPTSIAINSDRSVYGARAWWLSYCFEHAEDATTLEEAQGWHGRIVRELTRRIAIVTRSNWPPRERSDAIFDLMCHRIQHSRAILNIDHSLQWEEVIDWEWWR